MKRSLDDIFNSIGIDQLSKTPNGYKGCCAINPDHIDRKPSMHIHIQKGYVKCFSCGAFRTLFDFLIDNSVPFDEAIDFFFTDFEKKENNPEGITEYVLGRKIPKSMLDRGFSVGTLKHFGVGYDEYEKRITIPLKYNNILYGINYRVNTPKGKKIWSSEGFVKDNFIYNYEPTEQRIYVEGFTDTWKVWQSGTKNVSACLTAIPSDGQLSLMAQHKKIFLALDNDKAGWKGAFKIHKELGREIEIKIIPYIGKDPGDLNKSDWEKAINSAVEFMEFEVQMINRNIDLYNEIKKSI